MHLLDCSPRIEAMRTAARKTAPNLMRRLGEAAAETLWTTRCAVCDAPGELLCAPCAERLAYVDALRACPRCGAPYGAVQCTECSRTMLASAGRASLPCDAMASAVAFDEAAQRLVGTFKDRSEARLAAVLGSLIAHVVPPAWMAERPVVTFVPATRAARARRGFDHGQLLAQATADRLGLPLAALLDQPSSADQRRLGRRARLGNMGKRLRCLPGAPAPPAVIVVDDVCTTGATLYSAADALREGGTRTVYGAAFARVWD